jgi:hypothetical protein
MGVIVVSFNEARTVIFKKIDMDRDFYINYSQQFNTAEAVKIMSTKNEKIFPNETLFVAPDEWLIYWQAGLKPPSRINSYYVWMDKVPELKLQLDEMFTKDIPTYFYCNCGEDFYVNKYISKYQELKKDGKATMLYVLPQKLKVLTQEQISQLQFYGFSVN